MNWRRQRLDALLCNFGRFFVLCRDQLYNCTNVVEQLFLIDSSFSSALLVPFVLLKIYKNVDARCM